LQPYKGMGTRYRCPECNHRDKTFTRYIDAETGEHLADHVGRCSREVKCGYHYKPRQYFQDNNISFLSQQPQYFRAAIAIKQQSKPATFISDETFKRSLQHYEANHFINFLIGRFGKQITTGLVETYFIGTSKHWPGSTVFWQIDASGKIRTGKIMLYNPATGKRVKDPRPHITWVHSVLKEPNFQLKQCLFGEHLLKDKTRPVAIVESEKTALIANVYLPQFIWLAAGSLSNLNLEISRVLMGRKVSLFPDIKGYSKWSAKAEELSHLADFTVSDLLETKASDQEREEGLDLADYLLKFNCHEFSPKPEPPIKTYSEFTPALVKQTHKVSNALSMPQNVQDLIDFFEARDLPSGPIALANHGIIGDVQKFVESHLFVIKKYHANPTFSAFITRLELLKKIIF